MPIRIRIPPLKLHAGQAEVMRSRARFKVISAGRRFGKTLLAQDWLALSPGGAIEGLPTAFFSPTYKLLLDVWDEMLRTLKPVTRKANKTEMRLELVNGGKLDFWTMADKDAGRGRKYARVVLDEAAHAPYLKPLWERAVEPTLTDFQGEAWFISTPNGLNYFHDLYQRGLADGSTWASFNMPSTVNPYLPRAELAEKETTLPALVYRQEYLAEFVTFGGGLVKPEMILTGEAMPHWPRYTGVDLAISRKASADYTALATLAINPENGHVNLVEAQRLRCGINEAMTTIKTTAQRHKSVSIAVEDVQYQAAVVEELLRTTSLPVFGVSPGRRDKVERFMPLLAAYERGMVSHSTATQAWVSDAVLAFPHADEHDDIVDAMVYAYHLAKTTGSVPVAVGSRRR